jgi:hypothetical protein
LLQHQNGRLQVPLSEVQMTEVAVGNDGCVSAADQGGEAKRLLPATPTLGEVPEVAQVPQAAAALEHGDGLIQHFFKGHPFPFLCCGLPQTSAQFLS